jgi:hypothetical protein
MHSHPSKGHEWFERIPDLLPGPTGPGSAAAIASCMHAASTHGEMKILIANGGAAPFSD